MYDIKSLYKATSIDDAIAAMMADEAAVFIAGGSDVLIKIREGRLAGRPLVSIRDITALQGVRLDGEDICIGPLTTFAGLEEDPIISARIPMLSWAGGQAGGPQLRNIGTIGGNVCNGVTSADTASSLFALNALLVIRGPRGERTARIGEFYKGPGKVDLAHGELLTGIVIRGEDYKGWSGTYMKYAMRNAMDIATLGCAAMVKLNGGRVEAVRLAYGVASPTPVRCPNAEALAQGKPLSRELFEQVAAAALEEINPRTSWRASKEFRLQLAQELAHRALCAAAGQAGGVL